MRYNSPVWIVEKYIEFRQKHKSSRFYTKDVKNKIDIKNANELILLWEKYELIKSEKVKGHKICEFKDNYAKIFAILKNEWERLTVKEFELNIKLQKTKQLKNNILEIDKELNKFIKENHNY